jgi:hypothetical protein
MASTPPTAGSAPTDREAGLASARAIIAEALAPVAPDRGADAGAAVAPPQPHAPVAPGAPPQAHAPQPHAPVVPSPRTDGPPNAGEAGRVALFDQQSRSQGGLQETSDVQLAAALRVLAAGAEDLAHAGDALGMRELMASAAERISHAASTGDRSERIVRLAYEEAAKIVQEAEADAARLRADAQAAMGDVLDALQMVDAAHARLGHALESLGGQVDTGPHPSRLAEGAPRGG